MKGYPIAVISTGEKEREVREIAHVIISILPTDVEQSFRKIAISHLQSIIHRPQRRSERIADTGEATAGGGVGLEHHKRFVSGERRRARAEERLDDLLAGAVVQVEREFGLGIFS